MIERVTVPTVARLLAPRRFWSITMQGEMFRIASTGRASWGSRRPGVRAERLDELALRLGTDRVEHERRVAAPAHAREGDEPVLRHVDVDALEVVRAGTSDLDGGHLRPS